MKKEIILIAEAGQGKGLGHLYRMKALADLLSHDFQVSLLSNCSVDQLSLLGNSSFKSISSASFSIDFSEAHLVIVDGYTFPDALIHQLANLTIPVIEVSDFEQQLYPFFYWINSSNNTLKKEGMGLQYSLLRSSFLYQAQQPLPVELHKKRLFIAYGGTDEAGLTLQTLKAVLETNYFEQIAVLYPATGTSLDALKNIAAQHSHITIHSQLTETQLLSVLHSSDVCFVSSSTIACECIALRKMVFTACLYDNQKLLHEQLCSNHAAFSLNTEELFTNPNSLMEYIEALNETTISIQRKAQEQLIDGHAQERILVFIHSILHANSTKNN